MGIDKSIVTIGKYQYKRFVGVSWLLIFYHNVKLGGNFNSEAEARTANEKYKFSILDEIKDDERFRIDGKFEFLLQFSDIKGFNRWKQTNFPLNEENNNNIGDKVEGYENISISWTENRWGGLAKTVLKNGACVPCLLDGTIKHPNYFYTIGNYGCNGGYLTSSPANNDDTNEVALWIRVQPIHVNIPFTCSKKHVNIWYIAYTISIIT